MFLLKRFEPQITAIQIANMKANPTITIFMAALRSTRSWQAPSTRRPQLFFWRARSRVAQRNRAIRPLMAPAANRKPSCQNNHALTTRGGAATRPSGDLSGIPTIVSTVPFEPRTRCRRSEVDAGRSTERFRCRTGTVANLHWAPRIMCYGSHVINFMRPSHLTSWLYNEPKIRREILTSRRARHIEQDASLFCRRLAEILQHEYCIS